MRTTTRKVLRTGLALGGAAVACTSLLAAPVAASVAPATSPAAAASPAPAASTSAVTRSLPDNPVEYATATFDAWQQGNLRLLARLTEPQVFDLLAAHPPITGDWVGPECEGAAGSTYCTWTLPEVQLVLRVNNELASQGAAHAVIEASLTTAPDRVAIWPLTTQEEADNTQEQVDQGHSPWMLEPEAVASSYASAELGWQDAPVEVVGINLYRVTDPETGAQADLALGQPARFGPGGIWAVTRAGSALPS